MNFTLNLAKTWKAGKVFFSDYPVGSDSLYELEFSHAYLPPPLDGTVRAIKISGINHSDDLLSFVVRKFDNLKPNAVYSVSFRLYIASNATINAAGIGGSPDLGLAVGGLSYQPANAVSLGYYRPNFTSRIQSYESNDVLKLIGRIGVSAVIPTPFMLIQRDNLYNPVILRTNEYGELWLMIGTDSGFEGVTSLYYRTIAITLRQE